MAARANPPTSFAGPGGPGAGQGFALPKAGQFRGTGHSGRSTLGRVRRGGLREKGGGFVSGAGGARERSSIVDGCGAGPPGARGDEGTSSPTGAGAGAISRRGPRFCPRVVLGLTREKKAVRRTAPASSWRRRGRGGSVRVALTTTEHRGEKERKRRPGPWGPREGEFWEGGMNRQEGDGIRPHEGARFEGRGEGGQRLVAGKVWQFTWGVGPFSRPGDGRTGRACTTSSSAGAVSRRAVDSSSSEDQTTPRGGADRRWEWFHPWDPGACPPLVHAGTGRSRPGPATATGTRGRGGPDPGRRGARKGGRPKLGETDGPPDGCAADSSGIRGEAWTAPSAAVQPVCSTGRRGPPRRWETWRSAGRGEAGAFPLRGSTCLHLHAGFETMRPVRAAGQRDRRD